MPHRKTPSVGRRAHRTLHKWHLLRMREQRMTLMMGMSLNWTVGRRERLMGMSDCRKWRWGQADRLLNRGIAERLYNTKKCAKDLVSYIRLIHLEVFPASHWLAGALVVDIMCVVRDGSLGLSYYIGKNKSGCSTGIYDSSAPRSA